MFRLSKLLFYFLLIYQLFFISCRSENEEDYFKNKLHNNSGNCDTAYITFSKQVQPIFNAKCVSCHTNGSALVGCDLDTYSNTMKYVNAHQPSTKLYDWVKDNTHQGVVLDSCELKQLHKWILNPAP